MVLKVTSSNLARHTKLKKVKIMTEKEMDEKLEKLVTLQKEVNEGLTFIRENFNELTKKDKKDLKELIDFSKEKLEPEMNKLDENLKKFK